MTVWPAPGAHQCVPCTSPQYAVYWNGISHQSHPVFQRSPYQLQGCQWPCPKHLWRSCLMKMRPSHCAKISGCCHSIWVSFFPHLSIELDNHLILNSFYHNIYHLEETVVRMSLLFAAGPIVMLQFLAWSFQWRIKDAQGRSQPFSSATKEMPSISCCAKYSIAMQVKHSLQHILILKKERKKPSKPKQQL